MSRVRATVFVSINNLFKTDARYDQVCEYKRTGRLPASANRAFKRNYAPFELRDDRLYFTPLGIEIVPKRAIAALLRRLYDDPAIGLGKAKGSLYKYCQLHYGNINRREIDAFISKEPRYQLGQPRKARVNKPFLASAQDSLWCCDLVDLNPYIHSQAGGRWRYILTTVDVFSRRVWLQRLRHKEAADVLAAFKLVLRRAGHSPKRLLCDNGTEFAAEFEAFLKEKGVKVSHSRPYQPQSNSIVERANQEVRRRLKALFVSKKSLNWAQDLPVLEDNINASFHQALGTSPDAVYDADQDDDRVQAVRERMDKSARDKLAAYKDTEFALRDKVRVSMQAMFSSVRQAVKRGDRKQIIVEYTPESYEVAKIIKPRDGGLTRWRYNLMTSDGDYLKKGRTELAVFYASDLIHAHGRSGMTNNEALKLDGCSRTRDNDVYVYNDAMYFDDI